MKHYPETPWNLSPGEQKAMDAITAASGKFKVAAQASGANYNTMSVLVGRARKKMGAPNSTFAVVLWDRFKRGAA